MLRLLWTKAFSPTEREVLIALASGPLAAPTISKRLREASDEPSTKLRTLLSNLCDRAVLELTREGYRIADARLLEVARHESPPAGGAIGGPPERHGSSV